MAIAPKYLPGTTSFKERTGGQKRCFTKHKKFAAKRMTPVFAQK